MSNSENRVKTVAKSFRVEPAEYNLIMQKARDSGVTFSEFVRCAALSRKTRSTLDSQIINMLMKGFGLQKELFNKSGGGHSKEYAEILVSIKAAINRIANGDR